MFCTVFSSHFSCYTSSIIFESKNQNQNTYSKPLRLVKESARLLRTQFDVPLLILHGFDQYK